MLQIAKDVNDARQRISDDFGVSCSFHHVPTDKNPSDLLTRGLTVNMFLAQFELWSCGPEFIRDPVINWPSVTPICASGNVETCVNFSQVSKQIDPIFPVDRFSCVDKMERITALVLKFIDIRCKVYSKNIDYRQRARKYWIQQVQSIGFANEIKYLLNPKEYGIVPNLVNNLNLFLDEVGMLRSKGRLGKCSSADYNLINPIMLPKDSFYSKLLVRDFHKQCKHLGVASTLNRLRTCCYWLPKGRATIKQVLSDCITCKKINAFSFRYPRVTDFIKDKVNFTKPFQHTGVDYTGHFFVKMGDVVSKFYLLVFTCLSIRAIHLELVPSMSTSDFLLAFVKFCNIYNAPFSLYSDNASTFSQATKVLNSSNVDDPLTEYLEKNSIKHVKIPVYSAWIGSAWERLIRTIKSSIYKCVGRRKLEYHQFVSLLSDIQNSVNSRPLTYRDYDVNNLDVLTPNSFLKLGLTKELKFDSVSSSDIEFPNRKKLISTLENRDELFSKFKELWYESYLLSLREFSRDVFQNDWINKIKIGDIVLINSPIKIRAFWPLGRVVELLTGNDGKTRCVRVRRACSGEEVYSINHLYPLELSVSENLIEATDDEVTNSSPTAEKRPKRAAAKKALKNIQQMCN